MQVAGIDGTKGGWVVVALEDGAFDLDLMIEPIETRFEALASAAVLAIDVPIGFGPRAADSAARRYLSGAASTVFTTPPRDILETPFRPGLGVSAQAHALAPRGALERVALLRAHGVEIDELGQAAAAPLDDVLDAAAAAWTPHRIGLGQAATLPNPPELVEGRHICIWY
jgi:predicted RNase H-like nuclease